jgi:hypothetical protein
VQIQALNVTHLIRVRAPEFGYEGRHLGRYAGLLEGRLYEGTLRKCHLHDKIASADEWNLDLKFIETREAFVSGIGFG